MIAGEDRDRDVIEPWNVAALPVREPYRQLFETAETSRRLCQDLLPPRCGLGGACIAGGQIATEGADFV
jgi:hypothetical protein